MDIDLLAKMVGELILDNDEVALPGVGTFVAEMVPATFSDKGYTINPPYRRLSFRQKDDPDTKLVDFYARTNSLDFQDAAKILTPFLQEMKEVLKTKKLIIFPGLGRLRATRENNFFFVPDEDLNIYPAGFGLESISLKTHSEGRAEVAAAVASLEPLLRRPAPEAPSDSRIADQVRNDEVCQPAPEVAQPAPEVAQPAPEAPSDSRIADQVRNDEVCQPAPEVARPAPEAPSDSRIADQVRNDEVCQPVPAKRHLPRWVWIIPCVILCLALLLGIYILLAHIAPDFIDRLLYTPEELQILKYPLE